MVLRCFENVSLPSNIFKTNANAMQGRRETPHKAPSGFSCLPRRHSLPLPLTVRQESFAFCGERGEGNEADAGDDGPEGDSETFAFGLEIVDGGVGRLAGVRGWTGGGDGLIRFNSVRQTSQAAMQKMISRKVNFMGFIAGGLETFFTDGAVEIF